MNRANAPSYDLFKLVVTIVLVIILVLMLLRGWAAAPTVSTPAGNAPPSTQSGGQFVTTEAPPTSDTAAPAALPAPSTTPTAVAATLTSTSEPVTPTPETTAVEPAAATPTTGSADSTPCNTSVPSRLRVGQTARVVQRLNMRATASITAAILRTNSINTQVEIIGGPVCTPAGESAYLWWQIRLANGEEGWSAESPLNDATYLLEPVP